MTRAVVFYPSNARSIALETMMMALRDAGVEIELLTMCKSGPLHDYLRLQGIATYAHPLPRRPALCFYLKQCLHLVRFTRTHGSDVVLAHLQQANIVAVFARFLSKARVIPFRHHFDFVFASDGMSFPQDRTEMLFDRIINRLSKTMVVPSQAVAAGMERLEGVDPARLKVVRYVYDFDRYERPQEEAVRAIRAEFPARLTLLMVSRLIPLKRPGLAFHALLELVREGLDIRLLVLGDGPDRQSLEAFVKHHQLDRRITMLGHRDGVVNYMAASDLLVHPSLTEASCNAVKEMALMGRSAIVCDGVGDFDEYIADGQNGFVMPRWAQPADLAAIIRRAYGSPEHVAALGEALRGDVLDRFSVSAERVEDYLALLK